MMARWNIILFAILTLGTFTVKSQTQRYVLDLATSSITVTGTSSFHEWEVVAKNFSGSITIRDVTIPEIMSLDVTVIAGSLRSGNRRMDKTIHITLKSDEFQSIIFNDVDILSSNEIDDSIFEITLLGKLTVTGVVKEIPVDVNFTVSSNTINLLGSYSFNMTEFGIEPPRALLGTVKSGDLVNIKFNTNFKIE